jgi:hypothetical protein
MAALSQAGFAVSVSEWVKFYVSRQKESAARGDGLMPERIKILPRVIPKQRFQLNRPRRRFPMRSCRPAPLGDRPHVDLLGGPDSLHGPGADDLLFSRQKLGRKSFGGVLVREIPHMKRRRIIRRGSPLRSMHVPFVGHYSPHATH